jgi:hypothetical protein
VDKFSMRDWVSSLEAMVDNKLKKWKKEFKIENGEAIQLRWQFEQTHIVLNVFWEDKKETVNLQYSSPRINHNFQWHGLTNKTFNKVQDRIGNLSMATMHPAIDPEDIE